MKRKVYTNGYKTFFEQEVDRIANEHGLPKYRYIQIRQSKAFMENYFSERIELKKIAASACMSQFHYIRSFKQVYGVTPREYLRDIRINKAKEFLKSGMTTTQVCVEVGYNSLPTFSGAFKKGTGYSPKAYQEMNKSNLE